MDFWVFTEGEYAIWHTNVQYWLIGSLASLGYLNAPLYSKNSHFKKKCPNNEGYVWNWNFYDGNSFMATTDVYIKCANEDDFCTSESTCGADIGDCDTHDECQDGLFCGSNNCPDSLGFHSEFDCCYAPAIGDEHFCTTASPCAVDEGDCDSNNECQTNHFCDLVNSCLDYLGFESDVNCCSKVIGCKFVQLLILYYLVLRLVATVA